MHTDDTDFGAPVDGATMLAVSNARSAIRWWWIRRRRGPLTGSMLNSDRQEVG
uniref:hypothetical protein n=1 Tax=Mycolicibacterium sp. CBMA 213 TaxID=1968788 RepID=UPI00155DBAD7|nr:hypothetical protein [Mycolicibacterium sp. CBMA 213]